MARKLGIHSWQNEKNYSHQINYMQYNYPNFFKEKEKLPKYIFVFGISTRVSAWRDPIFFARNIRNRQTNINNDSSTSHLGFLISVSDSDIFNLAILFSFRRQMYNGKGYDTSCWFRYQNFAITYRVKKKMKFKFNVVFT